MRGFEKSIGEMGEALMAMPREPLRHLETTMQRLTREQIEFVRSTLGSALLDDRLSTHRLTLLEHLFESWWDQSLATKLVLIDYVVELSERSAWPGGMPQRNARADEYGNVDAVISQ